MNEEIEIMKFEKLNKIFINLIECLFIQDFWMKSKLILLSKETNNTPEKNTRPIAILESITKVFEVSILGNLVKVVFLHNYLLNNQRDLTPKKSTVDNINDLFNIWFEAKKS